MAASVCRVGSTVGRALAKNRSPILLSLRRGQASVSYAQSLLGAPETRLTALDNGLRVASEETGHATCTVGLWISAGSRYENEKNNGAGFFLEHMAFKGTKNHPQTALEQQVESMGAHLSAYTSREHTAYYMKTLAKDLPKAVELLSEVVQSFSLNEADIEQQRAVVLRELAEVENNLQDVCLDMLHATAFQGTPLGQSVLGPSDNARTLTRQNLVDYINSHYKAPRMVLAAAGGVNHEELVSLARSHFSGMSFEYEGDAVPLLSPCRFTGSEVRMRDDALPLAHVAIAVEGANAASPDIVPLMVANSIIGSFDLTYGGGENLSSRLARLAAEHKLCHSFQAFHSSYSDTGLLGIHFVADKHYIEDMMHWSQNAWMNLCTTVTESDVARGKNALKASLVGQLNGTTPICDDIGRHILNYGRRIPLAEWDARIDAVTPKVLRDVCSKYIYDKCPAVAAVGPVEQLPDYNRMRSAMYWLRVLTMRGVRVCLCLALLLPWCVQSQRSIPALAKLDEDTQRDVLAVDILNRSGVLNSLLRSEHHTVLRRARAPRPASQVPKRAQQGSRFALSLDVPTSILSVLIDLAKNQD
ncbi:Cytochrome b-c1 complex subunit 1, partial [Nibea albiflora]